MSETKINTISDMFVNTCKKFPNGIAYGYKEKKQWKELTFSQVFENVKKISGGLKHFGLKPKDHLGIIANNNQWWAMADYATICSRGVVATIYPTLTAKQTKWIVLHSECKYLFCENKRQSEKVLSIIEELHHVSKVVVMNNDVVDHPLFITMDELLDYGHNYCEEHPDEFMEEIKHIDSEDMITLIYTSGTTGEPKGVMLSHRNLVSNVEGALEVIEVSADDVFLSFLPLSHSFERLAGHFLPFMIGSKVCYAENILKVAESMAEVKPTLMLSVPRLYEKIYGKVLANIASAPAARRKIFWWAINNGKKALEKKSAGKSTGLILSQKLKIADKLVFSKLKAKVGGRLRFFASGGAPLSKEIGEFFNAAGIIILEGYGITETSPVISINPLHKNKIGTVGPPLPNVKVKIAADGEILMKGPNLMKGYYKDKAGSDEVISSKGWYSTGDIGELDEDNYIKITDRKKNIIVTAGGKNVAPAPLENVLVTSKWVEQILIIGDRRKFLSALIVPSFPNLEEWAKENELKWENREELIQLPEVRQIYQRTISESMEGFAQFEKVKKFSLLAHEFTIESGELTPSMKVRRNIVLKRYEELIDHIYQV